VPPKIHKGEQRTPEWFQLRCGRLNGSRAGDMLATIKTGEAAARRNLRVELCLERLLNKPLDSDGYTNAAMEWGVEQEPHALRRYEDAVLGGTLNTLTKVSYVADDLFMAGCSPDALLEDGVIEVKCLKQANHWSILREQKIPSKYLPQLRHNMWVTRTRWVDFISFDPRFPENLQFYCERLWRKDADIEGYEKQAALFLEECKKEVEFMKMVEHGHPKW